MQVLRALARPMLASIFIIQGYDTFRRPEHVAARAEPVVRPLAERVSVVPAKTEQAVRLNGAVQMVAGGMLALGKFPRLSALAVAGTLVPTTLAGHRFWEEDEQASRAQQRIHFLKNASMLGGLLIAAGDTAGKPSLAWQASHAAQARRREAELVARTARAAGQRGAKAGQAATKAAYRAGSKAGYQAGRKAGLRAGAKAGFRAGAKAVAAAKAGKGSAKTVRASAKAIRASAGAARSGAKAGR